MGIDKTWSCSEKANLKECYDLAVQYEKQDIAKEVLREKSKKIGSYAPEPEGITRPISEMQILSEAINVLSTESLESVRNTVFQYAAQIDNLPDSAEKEYVLALLSLRDGMDVSQRLEAVGHIRAALRYTDNDPRYRALASILEEVDS